MPDTVDETPEMIRQRKAKAALKNAQANISELLSASDQMSQRMKSVADVLDQIASRCGDTAVYGHWPANREANRDGRFMTIKELLQYEAGRLRDKAV